MSASSVDIEQALNSGALDIDIRFNQGVPSAPANEAQASSFQNTPDAPNAPGGGHVHVTVQGHPGIVSRLRRNFVWVVWTQPEGVTANTAAEPPSTLAPLFTVMGNFAPDQLLTWARTLRAS